tara:strand:+ start:504 stop:692 length:189 start_codon:yes stop_codon:yes gene_type:complete
MQLDWLQILALGAGVLMLVLLWPRLKHWRENKVEAQPGDWSNAIFILGLVMLFVLLLVMSVQ